MQLLSRKNQLVIGFTLFSMFFGAGNLIFPPQLGAQAGGQTWPAMAGLTLSAVVLPVLGVIAAVRSGGLTALAGRVHPLYGRLFTILAYLSIGPCLAIPRTASTSFEMALPLLSSFPFSGFWLQAGYSVLFFTAAFLVALRPEKLTSCLGKVLCPLLLLLVAVIFLGCMLHPPAGYGPAVPPYDGAAPVQGFLAGYQTMDAIAALSFGIVIVLNLRSLGITEKAGVVRAAIQAGLVTSVLLLAVYSMLAHIGALSGGAFPNPANGAQALRNLVGAVFGSSGSVILAGVFVIACFNTCVGLISSCSAYFHTLVPKVPTPLWAACFALLSLVISNAGLNQILAFSIPVLNILYPSAIVLILLSLLPPAVQALRAIYPASAAFTTAASLLYTLRDLGVHIPVLDGLLSAVPLAEISLGWVLPCLAGTALGAALSLLPARRTDHPGS